MGCGYSRAEPARRTGSFGDCILRGTVPAERSVEEPTIYKLLFNLRTARQPGLTLAPPGRVRAHEVID